MLLNMRVILSILVYFMTMAILYFTKPSLIFHKDGSVKDFGLKSDQTIFSIGIFSSCVAIICFYIFLLLDLMYH